MYRHSRRPPALSQSVPYARGTESRELPSRPSTARASRKSGSNSPHPTASSPRRPESASSSRSTSGEASGPTRTERSTPQKQTAESPDAWFRRVIRAKKLSPLDVGDIFAFGDAGVHGKVPLSHVCEVMFDLDPDSGGGADPISDRMEEFLYEHSFKDDGEIVVDIKEALRSLDIWHLDPAPVSPPATSIVRLSKSAQDSCARAILLESKNRKLAGVVSSIQSENARLSRELEASRAPRTGSEGSSPARTSTATTLTRASRSPSPPPIKKSAIPTQVDEEELAVIANELTYTGVKQLEEQLTQMDKDATGFVSLKQLRWLLADHFRVETSETRLLEMCLGMNYNPQAQLDYKEFVTALLDILIYAAPSLAASKKGDVLSRFDKYLESGFPPDRRQARQLIEQLCRKYDLESDGRIALAELLRVLRCDLVEEHALHLAFPLTEKEAIQLILSTSVRSVASSDTGKDSTGAFVYYDEVLDELFGGVHSRDEAFDDQSGGRLEQAQSWAFWERVRKTLCNCSRAKEASVLAQILKIVRKLDRSQSFTVSPLFFKRIFDQHLRSEDVYVLSRVLQIPGSASNKDLRDRNTLRYDVFLFMTFGAPRITQDVRSKHAFVAALRSKLAQHERTLRVSITDVMRTRGAVSRLALQDFCKLVAQSNEREPLAMVELLFLFAALSVPDESVAQVEVKTLWRFLVSDCWGQSNLSRPSSAGVSRRSWASSSIDFDVDHSSFDFIRKMVAECLNDYNLERALAPYKQKCRDWVVIAKLAAELVQMFGAVGVSSRYNSEKEVIRELEAFLSHIARQTATSGTTASRDAPPFPGAISLYDFFDFVFDWTALLRSLRLPHNLVEVNRQLQVFDWDKNGTVQCDDWNKAWRQMCLGQPGMHEWEIRVLQRRFPGTLASSASLKKASASTGSGSRESSLWGESINYSRLLVFLLDLQRQRAREGLCRHAIETIQRESTSATGEPSTFRLEKLFRSLDRDGKGFFNARDLVAFLAQSSEHQPASEASISAATVRDDDDERVVEWLENADAVAFVMRHLSCEANPCSSGQKTRSTRAPSAQDKQKAGIVTFDQFRRLVNDWVLNPRRSQTQVHQSRRDTASPPFSCGSTVVSSLRSLELILLEIAREVSQANGLVLPLRVFRYFSQGSQEQNARYVSARASSSPKSPQRPPRKDELSSPIKSRHRELQAATSDPLTPEKVQQVLQRNHHLAVSTHLVGQFFQHIGAASKHFLELSEFSRWAAPLAADTQAKVRAVVKKMIVKGKGGGGKVDLDRFLAQLDRRLLDAPIYSSRVDASFVSDSSRQLSPCVPVSLLLSKLHQLNISLSRPDMTALLRHFGMDDDNEYVDYTLFLQRLYDASLTGQA